MGFGRWALRLFGKAPVILTAVATAGPGDSQITLTWTTEENSIELLDYKIYDSDDNLITTITGTTTNQRGGSILLTNSTNTTYLTLDYLQTYIFRIVGRNYKGDGESRSFNSISPFTKPGAPSSISVGAGAFRQMTLTWTAPSDNGGSPITNYKVYVYRSGVQIVGSPYTESNILTKIYNSLADGNYTVSISAVNAAGEGPVRQLGSSFNIFDDPLVNTVTVTPGANQATFNFTSVTARSGTGPIDSYNIYANANKTTLLGTSATSSVVVTTRDGTNPLVYNAAGYTMYASIKTRPNGGLIETTTPLTVTGIMPYSVPTNSTFTATAGNTSADFSWSFSSNGSTITDYIIYNSNDERVNVAEIPYTNTTFNIGGLTNGTAYTYKVSAVNLAGESVKTSVTVTPSRVYNPYDLSGEIISPVVTYMEDGISIYNPHKFISIQYDSNYIYVLRNVTFSNSGNTSLIYKINKSSFTRYNTKLRVTATSGIDAYSDSYVITQNGEVNTYAANKMIIDGTNMFVFLTKSTGTSTVLIKVNLNGNTGTAVNYNTSSTSIYKLLTLNIKVANVNFLNLIKTSSHIYYFSNIAVNYVKLSDLTIGTAVTLIGASPAILGTTTDIQRIVGVTYNSKTNKIYIIAYKTISPYNLFWYKITPSQTTHPWTSYTVDSSNKTVKLLDGNAVAKSITYNTNTGYIYFHMGDKVYKIDDSDLSYDVYGNTDTTSLVNNDLNYLYYLNDTSLKKYNNNLEELVLSTPINRTNTNYTFGCSEYEPNAVSSTTPATAYLYIGESYANNATLRRVKLPFFAPNTTTAPATPSIVVTNKAAASGTATIEITPGASAAGVIIREYSIEYKLSTAGTWTTVTTKNTSIDIRDLIVGSTYNFRAKARSTGNVLSANYSTTRSLKVNGVPYNGTLTSTVSANASDSTKSDIKLDWTFLVADTTISPITSYTLQRKTTTGTIITTTPVSAQNIRTYTDSSITAGVSYDYIITATNNIGTSIAVTLRVSADKVPSAPTISGVTLSGSNWILSWTAPAVTTSAPITGYRIGYKINSDANYTVLTPSGTGTTYNFGSSTLTRGQYYDFQVAAINRCGTGVVATSSNNPIGTAPSVTVILTNGATIGNVDVNATTTSDFPITSYTIEYNNTGNNIVMPISNITSLPYTILTGYSTGTTVYVRISATSLTGTTTTGFSSIKIYGPPTFTFGTPTYGDRQVTLNFTGTPNGGTIRGYNIYNLIGGNYVRFNLGSAYTVTTSSTSSSYAITALTNGTQLQRGSAYTFYGKTDNGLLTATYSQINVTLPTLPGTPTGLAVSFTTSSPITLSWTAPSSTNSAIQGYYVYYNTVNNNSAGDIQYGARVSGTSVNITGLTQGQTYYFSVAAQNTIGVGSKTAYVSAVYPSVPGTPSDLRTNVGNLSIELFWFDPANGGSSITSYKIYENGSLKLTVPIGNTTLYPTGRRSYNLTGLTKGATYLYKVSAVNAVGEGGQSNQVSEIADSVPTAIPRSNISIDLDPDTNFIIRWTPPSDYTQNSNNSIISYQIAFAVETGGTSTLPGTLSNPNTNIPVPSGSWGTLNVYADRSNISTSIEVGVGLYEVIRSNLAVYTHVSSFYAVGSRKKGIQVLTNNATQYTGTGSNPTPGLVSYTTTNGITLQDEPTMPPVDIYNQYYTVPMSYTNLTSYTSNRSITIAIYNSPMASDDPYPNVLRNYDYSKRNMVFMIRSYNRYGWSDWSPFFSKNPNSVHRL